MAANDILNSCCKHLPDRCYNVSVSRIKDILYAIDYKLSEYMEWVVCFSKWGYGRRDIVCQISEEEAGDLKRIKYALNRHLLRYRSNSQACLNDDEVQLLIEQALQLVDMSCCNNPDRQDIQIDKSEYDTWAVKNPYCVPFEAWENAFVCLAPEIGVQVINQEVVEGLQVLFTSKFVDTLSSKCEILYTVDLVQKAINCKIDGVFMNLVDECKVDGKVSIKEIEKCAFKYDLSLDLVKKCISTFNVGVKFIDRCKFNYDLLFTQKPGCELKFETYMNLVTCNLSHDLIAKTIDCGLTLDFNINKNTPEIVLENGTTLAFCDFDFDITSKIDCELVSGIINEDFCHYDKSHDIIKILDEYNS